MTFRSNLVREIFMHLDWVKPIWQAGEHNAFTDLCLYRERLFLAFREAATHVSGDGRIRVLELTEQGHIRHRSFIQIEGVDLRDPKLSVTPDGKLLLIAYARHNDQDNNTVVSKPICWFSSDGKSWSSHHYFGDQFWWLWRVTWTGNECLGLAYNRSQQAINLYKGDPRRTFHTHKAAVFSKEKNGKGYPNESDIQILSDGTAVALLRRDQDTCTAQLGMSKKPYTQWQWDDLKDYVGRPGFFACLTTPRQS